MPSTAPAITHDTQSSFDNSNPRDHFAIARHAMRGEPIEIAICNRQHQEVVARVTPANALQLAQLLLEAAAKELGHK